ncbi:rhomboid-domain-containing protein [Nemania sp. FL0031]|nr:rhomboid-domain-containing protein [Nemania sp. FL0031]
MVELVALDNGNVTVSIYPSEEDARPFDFWPDGPQVLTNGTILLPAPYGGEVPFPTLDPLLRSLIWPPPVRLLGPILWSVGVCSTIYVGFATAEVYQDVQLAIADQSYWHHDKNPISTFEELQRFRQDRIPAAVMRLRRSQPERPEFVDSGNMALGMAVLTGGTHAIYTMKPSLKPAFMHTPVLLRNYTLLTSVFGHGGLVHLGINTYAMFVLIPMAAHTPVLKQSMPHQAAFYLSAGILSSLANHLTTIWPRGPGAYTPALGASGALYAMVGVVGVTFPDARVGIILLPGSMRLGDALMYIALFDAIGIFVKYPFLSLGHAAHLGGLAVGIAYAKYDGTKIWRRCRRLGFNSMRSLGVI